MENRYFQPEYECMDREQMRALQSQRLCKIVKQCYEHVPFYKQKFDEMGLLPGDIHGIDDIVKLPFTNKTDLRDNFPYGLAAVPKEDIVRVHASSGTTGKQTVVVYTQNDLEIWANSGARALCAAGCTKSDFVQISYGYGLFTGGMGVHYATEKLGAAVIPVSTGNTQRQIQIMQDFGSTVLCATPSYAMYLGEAIRDGKVDPATIGLRIGIFGAEAWSDEMRVKIEELLHIKAYDIYGLSEIAGPGVAYECSMQNGMHVNEDYFYPEILDPDTGEPLPDGEFGELVFTCIGKEALPLLRYRTHDISALTHEKCECGRTTARLMKLKGRTDDMLIIRGVNVFPSQVEYVLSKMGMDPNYMIIVDRVGTLDTMEVQVEMMPAMFSDSVREIEINERNLAQALQGTLNIAAKVKLVAPKSLSRFEGKAKRVIDNRMI